MTSTLKGLLGALFISFFFSANTSAQIISTIGGNGTAGNSGDGGQALSASVQGNDIAADAAGNVYFVTDLTIRKISASGIITTIAGDGTYGTGGDGGLATSAQFAIPRGIGCDASGTVYICDENRVRRISTSGIITTIAGSAIALGFSGDGGPATAALLNTASDVAVDGNGNIYIADKGNNKVRKIDGTTGIITTISGSAGVYLVAVTSAGIVYFVDVYNSINRVEGTNTAQISMGTNGPWGPDGVLATYNGYGPVQGLAVNDANYVLFTANNRVRVLKPLSGPYSNLIYTYAGNGTAAFAGDGGVAYQASLNDPKGIALRNSILYVSDKGNYRVRKVAGCTGVPATPTVITGSTTFCPGTSYTFSIPVSSDAFFYTWSFPYGWAVTSSNFQNTITVTAGTFSGTISVTANGLCGSSIAQTLNVSSAVSAPTFSPSGSLGLCPTGGTNLSVVPAPNCTIQWTKDNVLIPGATANTYNATQTGVYGVKETHTSGCAASYNGVTMVTATNVVSAYPTNQTTFCYEDSLLLKVTSNLPNGSGYQWKKDGLNIPNSNNDTFFAKQPGIYTVQILGCDMLSQQYSVTMLDSPVYTITPADTFICENSPPVTLTVNTTAPTVKWYLNTTLVDNDAVYTPVNPGLYNTIITGSNGCKRKAFYDLQLSGMTLIAHTPEGVVSCDGDDILFYVDSLAGYTFLWEQNGTPIPGATYSHYYATETGEYGVYVSDGPHTCPVWSSDVYIDSFAFAISTDGPLHLCDGEDVQLSVPYDQLYGYQWYLNGTPIVNSYYQPTWTVNLAGAYTVLMSNGDCIDTTDAVIVTVGNAPTPTITQNNFDLSVPSGFVSYQWYLNGSPIAGATSENYTATQDGDYYVVVSDGCDGQSNTVTISGTSVADVNVRNGVTVSPNPFTDKAVVSFNNSLHEQHTFSLYDLKGALVQDVQQTSAGEVTIHRGILPAGVYYFRLMKEGSLRGHGKLIIQ